MSEQSVNYPTIEQTVGNTPLVRLQRLPQQFGVSDNVVILAKLEGNNPAGSVKDRPALNMIIEAEQRGQIKPGDVLIEATSGNTGIALAMAAAIKGYKMILIMPDNLSLERRASMKAYGAELILTDASKGGMEFARDLATQMENEGKGLILNQFANAANPSAHYTTTGPELWEQTQGQITHFVSAMGTTGTMMGTGQFLKEQNSAIQLLGVQPAPGASIPGIRKWSPEYQPSIYKPELVDNFEYIEQDEAEQMARDLAAKEGIFGGISSAGALVAAIRTAKRLKQGTVVFIVCDRGDRYLSDGVFN